jgi:hypothetical protein
VALRIDDGEVLASGSVVVAPGRVVSIDVLPDHVVSFKFTEDESGKHDVRGTVSGGALQIDLLNIDNSLGVSYKNTIGTTDGSVIEMALFIHAAGARESVMRLLSYTFWKGGMAHE